VYLLYADESGDLGDASTQVFVVAGIAVHEDAIRPLAGEISGTTRRFLGRHTADQIELHGNPMRTGNGKWGSVSINKRVALYHEMLRKLGRWAHEDSQSKIEPFAVVMDRNHSQSPTETTYGELLYVFDEWLRGRRRAGDAHNGVLVADRSRYQRTLEAWVELARAYKSRPAQDPRRLYALAETPFFVDSNSTRLMQLADLLAHALYRAYNAGDWSYANTALAGFTDASRLVHFTPDSTCTCAACAAERDSSSPAEQVTGAV
jgi:Protein of unknown function (DUF3800)